MALLRNGNEQSREDAVSYPLESAVLPRRAASTECHPDRASSNGARGQAATLCNLARIKPNKEAITQAGAMEPLVALVQDGTDEQKTKAAVALAMLAKGSADKRTIAQEIAEPLQELTRHGTDTQKEMALLAQRALS